MREIPDETSDNTTNPPEGCGVFDREFRYISIQLKQIAENNYGYTMFLGQQNKNRVYYLTTAKTRTNYDELPNHARLDADECTEFATTLINFTKVNPHMRKLNLAYTQYLRFDRIKNAYNRKGLFSIPVVDATPNLPSVSVDLIPYKEPNSGTTYYAAAWRIGDTLTDAYAEQQTKEKLWQYHIVLNKNSLKNMSMRGACGVKKTQKGFISQRVIFGDQLGNSPLTPVELIRFLNDLAKEIECDFDLKNIQNATAETSQSTTMPNIILNNPLENDGTVWLPFEFQNMRYALEIIHIREDRYTINQVARTLV